MANKRDIGMPPKLVTLYDTNMRNPSATIRKIADEIDSGKYGQVDCVAVVLFGDTLEVFSAGPDSNATFTISLLQAGALRLVRMMERKGRDGGDDDVA